MLSDTGYNILRRQSFGFCEEDVSAVVQAEFLCEGPVFGVYIDLLSEIYREPFVIVLNCKLRQSSFQYWARCACIYD